MIFTSFDFLLFFLIVLAVQAVLPHRPRNKFLLGASYFFYGCWDWRFLSLIIASTLIDFTCSHAIAGSQSAFRRRLLLTFSVTANLSILGFFKYANFFVDSAEQLLSGLSLPVSDWRLDVILPVGISFYTFQTMSYTIDVYRGKLRPLDNLIDFSLYVAFFPQLVAGPIERGASLAPQMTGKPPVSLDDLYAGSWLVVKGVFKKAVIADNLAPVVQSVFSASSPSGPEVLIGVYAFAFQIYGDFAGYSDIARGTARMMGYRLMLNFRLPYFATNPSEFWQRWHISLSSWLRDYLYIPLGGNRGGTLRTCRNLMITMVLGGLWHGAAWTFVVWGAYHGAILVAYRLVTANRQPASAAARPSGFSALQWGIQVAVMFHLVCIGWLLFRAESLAQAGRMLAALVGPWQWTGELAQPAWQIVLLCGPLLMVQLLEERTKNLNLIPCLSLLPRTLAYAATLGAILTLGNFGGQEFIYFQF